MQFSAPPPPIAQSMVLRPQTGARAVNASIAGLSQSSVGFGAAGTGAMHSLLVLERRQAVLRQELQQFLDAQSAGLVVGGAEDDVLSEGSSTPTSLRDGHGWERRERRSLMGARLPKPKERKKVVGLKTARKGLLRDIREMAALKGEESAVLGREIARREEVLERVRAWEDGIRELKEQVGRIEGGEGERAGLEEMKREERELGDEIRELEDQLAQMKARKYLLEQRIGESENERDARASSSKFELQELEAEVRQFLRRPPVLQTLTTADEGFLAMSKDRRTLGMARDFFASEVEGLEGRKGEVETERLALGEGAVMWARCVDVIGEMEEGLQRQIVDDAARGSAGLGAQLGKLDAVIEVLDEALGRASEKGWNLLVCAVGAELEAMREGKEVLLGLMDQMHWGSLADRKVEGGQGEGGQGEAKQRENSQDAFSGLDASDRLAGTTDGEDTRSIGQDSSDENQPPLDLMVARDEGEYSSS